MEDILPSDFHFSKNYPNPFKENTIIKYCVPYRIKIKLEVLKSAKESIAVLVDKIKPAGMYQVEFNAKELDGGVYFYKLESRDYFETKKMVIMK